MTGDHFFIQIFQNRTGFFSQARCFAGHLTNIVKAPKKTKMTRFASHLNSDLNYNFQTSHFISTFLSTHADRLDVDISFTVCYLFFFVCTVMDFSSERSQILHSGLWASWAGNLPFWGTLFPQKP